LEKEYCIYRNDYFLKSDMNIEHIIPLSLGGCDDFTIPVNKQANSELGSKVDGKFINDFLIKLKQINMESVGHSKKKASLKIKNCSIDGSPVNVTFSKDAMKVFDPIKRKRINKSASINMNTRIDMYSRIKFVAKVALSTGYFLFGDKFVENADHESLRKIIFSENEYEFPKSVRVYDNLHPIEEKDEDKLKFTKFLFEAIGGSAVIFSFSEKSFIVHVSIGSEFVGMVNFLAEVDEFPVFDDSNRLGHVLLCRDGKLYRDSYWKTIYKMNKSLGIVEINDDDLEF